MLHEFINNDKNFEILFTEFFGGGWFNPSIKIIEDKIKQQKLSTNLISVAWHEMEAESNIEKDGVEFMLKVDDIDSISLILLSEATESNKQKLREWATIIAEEVEKIKR